MHPARPDPSPWQSELARGYRTPAELLADLGLDPAACGVPAGDAGFPFRVPRSFAARMRWGDPRDPLLLQVLPLAAEHAVAPGFVSDPVGDLASALAPGLLQKYAGRALLVTTGACAINCRYCFRRHFPYSEQGATGDRLESALARVAADHALEEVILSGGDPLVLADHRLEALLHRLDGLPHVQRIRLHSRVPVVLPGRVDQDLLALLRRVRKQVVVVVHANHANEIDDAVREALLELGAATGPVLNQSVLLRGVNDNPAALAALSRALFSAGVMPYYLHQLDPVAGAAHFAVPDPEALQIVAALAASLPGYLVPKLVREVPGEPAKQPVTRAGAT
jgi:EF-P beta-lysylation protein EpmB